MKPLIETLQRYAEEIRLLRLAHYRAAQLTMRRHHALGLSIVILATLAGTLSMTQAVGYMGIPVSVIVGLLCITCAGLATIQTFLNYWERAEKHRFAATQYSALGRELELMNVKFSDEFEQNESLALERLSDMIAQLNDLSQNSPSIPNFIWANAQEDTTKYSSV